MNPRHMLAALTIALLPPPIQARDASAPILFQGRHIVSVSDADMLASAYVDGHLGPREGTDALSVIEITGDPRDWKAIEVPVTNSVAGPPVAVELSPDGHSSSRHSPSARSAMPARPSAILRWATR